MPRHRRLPVTHRSRLSCGELPRLAIPSPPGPAGGEGPLHCRIASSGNRSSQAAGRYAHFLRLHECFSAAPYECRRHAICDGSQCDALVAADILADIVISGYRKPRGLRVLFKSKVVEIGLVTTSHYIYNHYYNRDILYSILIYSH